MALIRFSTYLKDVFGERVQRISLHASMTCPNRDGTVGEGGCIYCSNKAFHRGLNRGSPVLEQLQTGMERARNRYKAKKFLAYFQTYSNTYSDTKTLQRLYRSVLEFENVVGLMISTRPDCIDKDIVSVLKELSHKTLVWVELGVQSRHNLTLERINRCHTREHTEKAIQLLEKASLNTAAHVILGLPGETGRCMMQTADWLAGQNIRAIKLHQLHAVKGTTLEKMYFEGLWKPLKVRDYINYASQFLNRMPDDTIVMRTVADCPKELLVAPRWSLPKQTIENAILKEISIY
jgi:uncharacterized protein